MYKTLLLIHRGRQSRIRAIVLTILICLVATSFSAELLIISSAQQDWAGDDGRLHKHIEKAAALDVLIDDILASSVVLLAVSICLLAGVFLLCKNVLLVIKSATLVGIRVRMNN